MHRCDGCVTIADRKCDKKCPVFVMRHGSATPFLIMTGVAPFEV